MMTRLLLLAVAVATSRAQNLAADKQGNLVASVEGRLEEPGITILRLTIMLSQLNLPVDHYPAC